MEEETVIESIITQEEESLIEKCDRLEEENKRLKEAMEQMINERIRELDERKRELELKMMLEEQNKVCCAKMPPPFIFPLYIDDDY